MANDKVADEIDRGMTVERGKQVWMSSGALAALALGYLVGGWGQLTANQAVLDLAIVMAPIGRAWINALRVTVLPLIMAQLIYSIVSASSTAVVARLSALAMVTFTLFMIVSAFASAAIVATLLPQYPFAREAVDAFRAAVAPDVPLPAVANRDPGAWVNLLIPGNIVQAASQDNLLGLLVAAILFGAAASRLPADRRELIGSMSRAVAETTMVIVRWLMWVMPVAVFVLALSLASRNGLGAVQVLGTYIVLICALLVAWILSLYGVAVAGGGVSLSRFARAMMPVHAVAAGTRSSLATLPSLMESAQMRLGLRPDVVSSVLPLAVSTFKINYPITTPFQFMFVAHVYGVPLSPMQVASCVAVTILISVTTLGLPSGGGAFMRAAPIFVAAGVPLEGYVLTEAVDAIPDVFMTLINVTADLTAATVVHRVSAPHQAVVNGPVSEAGAI